MISVNDIEIDYTTDGYPRFVHITAAGHWAQKISIVHSDLTAVIDALKHARRILRASMNEQDRKEV